MTDRADAPEAAGGMVTVLPFAPGPDDAALSSILLAYFTEQAAEVLEGFGVRFDPASWLEEDRANLDQYAAPGGQMLLAWRGGEVIGCGAWRRHPSGLGEIKRMFVRPEARRLGAGRAVLRALLDEAQAAGITRVVLDSPDFAAASHALYRAEGFVAIPAYPESGVPAWREPRWRFFGRDL